MTEGAHYWRSPEGTIEVHPLEKSGGHYGRSTAGGVWMVLWKLRRSGEFKKMSYKVGSRKSFGSVGLLQTLAGIILYPTNSINQCNGLRVMMRSYL